MPVRIILNIARAFGMIACLLGVELVWGQAAPAQKPVMAEDVFKNVQVLRGIPIDEFMDTMGFISASTGLNCIDCHTEEAGSSWPKYADDTALKQTTRRMILMVNRINSTDFGGRRAVTCYSCHRVSTRPEVIPNLAAQYSVTEKEPDEILEQASGQPAPDQILDKYIQSLGGAERLAKLASFTAKGTYDGYETSLQKVAVEVYAKAPGQRQIIAHTLDGDVVSVTDGRLAWSAAGAILKPLPVIELTGGELEAAKFDAVLAFPARIKQSLTDWRVGEPVTIDDRDIQVVQGTSSVRTPVKLYFDPQSGLLVRLVRYIDTRIGFSPMQIDYSDYREVAGVKMPFRWIVTWVDNKSTIELSEIRPNVSIDATRFAKPAPPVPPKPVTR
jgi:hypothetical protein